jgi:CDP-diacylglycerol--serine O-phosphatidyltransferase
LFTAGNLFLGFLAITKALEGAMYATRGTLGHNPSWEAASIMIGVAVFLDGLDGRIARMTNTVSEFGRELDSLADVITFGVAPAVLAWVFGIQFVERDIDPWWREQISRAGYFVVFLFVLCGASRLARFNIQVDPRPKNPGRPGRKYFVGLPIPAAAAMVAAIVYAANSEPLLSWISGLAWIALIAMLSTLMVSRWRYRSFKDFNLLSPRSPRSVVMLGSLIYLIWNYSQVVLLAMAITYVGSGIVIRIGGIAKRRWWKPVPPADRPQMGLPNG